MIRSAPVIALVGQVCIDHNTSERQSYTSWGSPLIYMAQYYKQHSDALPVGITSYGPDILQYLPDITLVPARPNRSSTLVYENDTSGAERIWRCHNTAAAVPPEITPEVIAAIARADIVVVATILSNYSAGYVRELLGYAAPDSLKVLCPQGYFRHIAADGLVKPDDFAEAASMIPLFDLVIYSEEDYPNALPAAQTWSKTNDVAIIVTHGPAGATIVSKEKTEHVPTVPVPPEEIIDSVGCGDVFAATVTLEYYKTQDMQVAVRAGHRAAGAKLRSAMASNNRV